MTKDNPDDLRKRADDYRQIARRMTDDRAISALNELAWEFTDQADQLEAKAHSNLIPDR